MIVMLLTNYDVCHPRLALLMLDLMLLLVKLTLSEKVIDGFVVL
jgi:hypothetical protein